jgi:hypothetical protein
MEKRTYRIFADYFQFYLWDKEKDPLAPVDYTDVDIQNRIKTGPNVVVVQPLRNMYVPVELEVCDTAPNDAFAEWDHVAECTLELPSGHLEIHECTGGPIDEFVLSPGTYRVRSYFGSLASISDDGLEGDDHYRIIMWPAPKAALSVLKLWSDTTGR